VDPSIWSAPDSELCSRIGLSRSMNMTARPGQPCLFRIPLHSSVHIQRGWYERTAGRGLP